MPEERQTTYLRRLKSIAEGARRLDLKDTDRHFDKTVFCGAGDHTRHNIDLLHGRIDRAFRYLSGRQQGPRWESPPSQAQLDAEKASNDEAEVVCEQVVRDVAMALTGKEINFRE